MCDSPKPGPSTKADGVENNGPKRQRREPVSDVLYPDKGQALAIMEKLNKQRDDGHFCDVSMKLSASKTIHAHKAILALHSPYFEGMFMSAFIESTSDVIDLSHLAEGGVDTFEKIIDTFYGGQFHINKENAFDALNFASMLFLGEMKQDCARVIEANVSLCNVPQLLTLSVNYELEFVSERLEPFIKSRFHDYLLFQEEMLDITPEAYQYLVNNLHTDFISRKGEFIKYVLKWFSMSEKEDRAVLLLTSLEKIEFKVNKRAYKLFETDLEDLFNQLDLDHVNSDVNAETRAKLKEAIIKLRPADYMRNTSPTEWETSISSDNGNDSELEDERHIPRTNYYARLPVYGPRPQSQKYTREEEDNWSRHYKEMAERDQHREWAERWPIKSLTRPPTPDPERPKKIRRDPHPRPHKTRQLRAKSPLEIAEGQRLLSALFVLAPSSVCGQIVGDTFDISVYIPRKHAWYKISTIKSTSINDAFPGPPEPREPNWDGRPMPELEDMMKHSRERRRRRGFFGHDDSDDEDEEMMHMMMGAPEMMPEMMMMHHMPPSQRRRFMEEMARGRVAPSSLRRRLMMDSRSDDMTRHDMMMRMMRRPSRPTPKTRRKTPPSLGDNKWEFLYFRHRLYFYHQEMVDSVFCYDISSATWARSKLEVDNPHPEHNKPEFPEGIELVIIGRSLTAVVRVAQLDLEHEHRRYYRMNDDEDRERYVTVKYMLFQLEDEFPTMTWNNVMNTQGNLHTIPIEDRYFTKEQANGDMQDKRKREELMYMRHMMRMMEPRNPTIEHGYFRTVCCTVDDEQFYIITAVKDREPTPTGMSSYKLARADVILLDLKEEYSVSVMYHGTSITRRLLPVADDDITVFFNDDLRSVAWLDTGAPLENICVDRLRGGFKPEQSNEFAKALRSYPRCPAVTAGDGESIWVLRGRSDNTSELSEIIVKNCYQTKQSKELVFDHPAPPYKCFAMADAGKIDRQLLRGLGEPMKYQHED